MLHKDDLAILHDSSIRFHRHYFLRKPADRKKSKGFKCCGLGGQITEPPIILFPNVAVKTVRGISEITSVILLVRKHIRP